MLIDTNLQSLPKKNSFIRAKIFNKLVVFFLFKMQILNYIISKVWVDKSMKPKEDS